MLTLTRKGNKVYVDGEPNELDVIESILSVYMDGAEFSQKFQDKVWDGYVRFFFKRWKYFFFGHINRVVLGLKEKDIEYKTIGFNKRPTDWVKFSKFFIQDERFFQRDSIISFLENGYGIIKVPTRGGKTFIASEIIRLLIERYEGLKVIFIVDSADLFEQAPADISLVTGMKDEEIGRIRGDVFSIDKPVTIAMIQTLQSILSSKGKRNLIKKKQLEKFLKEIDFSIIDEVQEFGSSKPRLAVLRKMDKAHWNLCLSATPFKDEDEIARLTVESFSGGVTYEIEEETLVELGVLADNNNLLLFLEHGRNYADYRKSIDSLIIENTERNQIIVNLIRICNELDLKTLVIFNSVKHGDIISQQTGILFLKGEHGTKERKEQKLDFLKGKGGLLLVSDIWKKGITLPEVEVLINVSGGKESSLVIQRRGRILGVTKTKKKALFIDIIDHDNSYLSEHSVNRIRAIENKVKKKRIKVMSVNNMTKIKKHVNNWFND